MWFVAGQGPDPLQPKPGAESRAEQLLICPRISFHPDDQAQLKTSGHASQIALALGIPWWLFCKNCKAQAKSTDCIFVKPYSPRWWRERGSVI